MPRISNLFLAAGLCIVFVAVGTSARAQTTWTGATSSDWFTGTNWTSGVPTNSVAAIIASGPSNQPVVAFSGATCKTLTLNTGATLTLTTGNLYVHGAVTVKGTLTFTTGTLLLLGDFINSGTLNRGQGMLIFQGGGTKKLVTGGDALYNLVVSGGVVKAQASLTLASLDVNGGSMDLGFFGHTISGNCSVPGGVTGTGLITLTGTGTLDTGTASVAAVLVTGGTRRISGATISRDLTLAGGATHIDKGTVTVHGNFDHQARATLLQVNSPGALDVNGSVTLSGPFSMPAGKIFCRGHWTSGSSFKPTGGEVLFSNGPLNINALKSVFHDLTFNPFGTKTLQTALDVDGLLTVSSNTPLDIGTFTHKIAGGFVMNGTLIGTGLIELDGSGVFNATPGAVARVEVTAGTLKVTTEAKVSSSLRVKAGKLQATTGTLSAAGAFTVDAGASAGTNTGATFDLDGTITWNGSCSSTGGVIRAASAWTSAAAFLPSAGTVELDGAAASITNQGSFHKLRITAGVKTANGALDVNGGLEVEAGSTLNLGAFTHTVTGGLDVEGTLTGTGDLTLDGAGDMRVITSAPDVTVTGGPVTVNTLANLTGIFHVTTSGAFDMTVGTLTVQGNVTLDKALTLTGGVLELSGGAATLTCPGSKLADLTVSGGTKTPTGALDVAGKLTVASGGTLAMGAFNHAVAGGLDFEGTLTGTGLIELTGPGSLRATSQLPRLKVSGGPVTVSATARIDTLLEVTAAGRIDVASGGDLRVNGDVVWDGACQSTDGVLRCGKDFTATGTGFKPTGGTVMLDGSGGGVLSASGAVFHTLEIAAGSKSVAAGTVAFDKELLVSGGTFTTAGPVTLSPKAAAAIRVPAGGTLELHGDSWRNPVLVAGRSSGRWTFEVKGTLGLRYFTIEDLDAGGLHVDGGAFSSDPLLGNGTFDLGAPGGVYFKVSGFSQTTTLRNVYFPTDPGSSAKNVHYTATTGRIVFENALGVFKGPAHENDPGGRVDWTLGPIAALRLSEIYQDLPRGVEVAALDTPVDLDGRILAFGKAGGATGSFTLPALVLQLDDYVELRENTGPGGPALVFLGGPLPWTVGGGGFASLQNSATGGGIDFVRWGGSSQAPPAGTAFTDSRGSLPAPAAGQSLGRDMNLTDTDTREDWEPGSGRHATYPTRGARNILFGVPYLWEGGEDPNPFTVDAPGAANLWHVDQKRFYNPNSRKPEAGPPPDIKAWTFNTGSPAYNYKTGGRVLGALRSPPIRLPNVTDVRLGYFEWLQTRNTPGKDICIVEMRQLGTTLWVQLAKYDSLILSSFIERTLDVSIMRGKDVEVRWTFDSVDSDPGAHEGWYVDFITVYRTSLGHPLVSPGQNGPPPPPVSTPPEGGVLPTGGWAYGGPGVFGKTGQRTQLCFVPIGSTALGMEVKTGLFAVRKIPGVKPGTWKDVVVLQAVPPELTGFIQGEPYPEIRLPLPVIPGLAFRVWPVDEASILLPASGMPAPVPDAPGVEVTGGKLVIRPFGLDSNRQGVQRHTLRFLILWDWQ